MSEIVKEKLSEQYINVEDLDDDDMQSLIQKCNCAKRGLSVCINEMRDCIDNANIIYRYCLSWPAVVVKHKAKK